MKHKFSLLIIVCFVIVSSLASADMQNGGINWIVKNFNPPTFTNLENKTHPANESFIYDVNAVDDDGISCFTLNDTSVFNIDCDGLILNVSALDYSELHWFNITVNDTLNSITWEEFYINITEEIVRVFSTGTLTIISTSPNFNVSSSIPIINILSRPFGINESSGRPIPIIDMKQT